MRLNLAVFDSEYEDMQLFFNTNPADLSVLVATNAGKATVAGVELETLWQPIEQLRFTFDYTYLDASFDEVSAPANTIFDPAVNPESPYQVGDNIKDVFTMPYAPENSYNLGADWTFAEFGSSAVSLILNYRWEDRTYFSAPAGPAIPGRDLYSRDAYGLLDARVSWRMDFANEAHGRMDVYMNNVLDDEWEAHAIAFGNPIPVAGQPAGYTNSAIVLGRAADLRHQLHLRVLIAPAGRRGTDPRRPAHSRADRLHRSRQHRRADGPPVVRSSLRPARLRCRPPGGASCRGRGLRHRGVGRCGPAPRGRRQRLRTRRRTASRRTDGPGGPDLRSNNPSVVLVHSTVRPRTVRDLESEAAANGVTLLDAPVTGGARLAERGELVAMVGGPASGLQAARPVLDAFCRSVLHAGALGSGMVLKAANNLVTMLELVAAHESLRLVERGGVTEEPAAAGHDREWQPHGHDAPVYRVPSRGCATARGRRVRAIPDPHGPARHQGSRGRARRRHGGGARPARDGGGQSAHDGRVSQPRAARRRRDMTDEAVLTLAQYVGYPRASGLRAVVKTLVP